jgi:hypothetical protein
MYNNLQFEFKGFDPEYEIRNLITNVAEKLHLSSPSDSAMKVAMRKGEGVIEASCRIASHAGTFVAHVVGENPIKAIQKIEQKIGAQLENWKRNRFAENKRPSERRETKTVGVEL